MSMEFHFPADLLQLLVDTIPLLCRSKVDVITFFRGAGVESAVLADLEAQVLERRESISKYALTRTVLMRLNEQGDKCLGVRRLVLKRVTEWESFSTCYPDNQQKARVLVKQVCEIVGVKDALTKAEEIEQSRRKIDSLLRRNELHQRKRELAVIRNDLVGLTLMENAQVRGKLLEGVLNQYFRVSGLLVREAFTLAGTHGSGIVEQVDGAIEMEGELYLVEMKWWKQAVGVPEIAQHVNRLYCRSHASGIFISASGFTSTAVELCRDVLQQKLIILCELKEIMWLLEQEQQLTGFLQAKRRVAILEKNPLYFPLSTGIGG